MGSRLAVCHAVRLFTSWQVIRAVPFKLEVYLTARGEVQGAVMVGLERVVGYIVVRHI